MEESISFADTVAGIMLRLKERRGHISKLCRAIGKSKEVVYRWRKGEYLPNVNDRTLFIEKALQMISEMEKEDKELKESSMLIQNSIQQAKEISLHG